MKNYALPLAVLSLLTCAMAASATEVSGIFRDHMVVQRDKPLPVWGRAAAGERVRVSFHGAEAETTADGSGRWQVVLPASGASREGQELVVAGKDRLVFTDVLVGDVWLISGQSNAEMKLGSATGAAEEAEWCATNAPLIRTTKFAHGSSFGPEEYKTLNGPWCAATKRDVRQMTALGYFFAKEIVTRTGVPIGILDNNRSGCRIEPYLAPEGYALTPGLANERIVTRGSPWYYTQYYSMIQPIVRFPIAGAVWYQGCSNSSDPGTAYCDKLLALANGWRAKWGYAFPFYIVSLASWDKVDENPAGGTGFGAIRDLQRRAATALSRSGLVVTTDLGEAKDIHPKNKREVGRRAALWARRDVYGEKDLVVSGPLFKNAVAEGGALRVNFTSCGGGLVAEGGELKGFALAGEDRVWHWAEGRIDGTSVVVSSPSVPAPVAVRYAFHGNVLGRATLRNAEGLPASPFRSDDWPTGSVFVKSPSFADFDLRAKAGEDLTVVYFGGSLTWSANASEPNRTGFRGRMSDYFRQKYPKARFTFVDAAIGGTGSKLGVFRLERDVLAHDPDLVFIDFICNDGGECRDIASSCCYEYLLRSVIGRGVPVMQMFFTFEFWAAHGAPYDAPGCHPRLQDYRRLVDAYATGVGDVYTDALIPAIDDGSIDPDRKAALKKVWPIDSAHPGDLGYGLFAKAGQIGYERAVAAKRVCRVPAQPVLGTVKDVMRTNPADGELPAGWRRALSYRTSAWYDGLSSRWMEDVAAFSGQTATSLSVTRTGNLFAVFGEGDGASLGWDLAVDGATAAHREMKFPAGRLMVFRAVQLDGWEKGLSAEHAFTLTPVPGQPAGKDKAELRIGSLCTATLVPDAKMYAETKAADDAANPALRAKRAAANLEKLDHGRGQEKQTQNSASGGIRAMKEAFERNLPETLESAKLTFSGVAPGYDVYNCSIPFEWRGTRYIFGRVEPHDKWASSKVMLFRCNGRDAWSRVVEFGSLDLEDPYIAWIKGELIVGGTRVEKVAGATKSYRGDFYRDNGRGPLHLEYYTSGPYRMKDIRLVELKDGRIGVFSRPRGEAVRAKYGSEAVIGFTTIADIRELTPELIENAPVVEGIFGKDEWGGCNQAYLLADGTVLVAAHLCYTGEEASNGNRRQIYCNAAFTLDPDTRKATHIRIVATRRMYPASGPKVPHLDDCVFTSGFVFNDDGTADIYTGLCDAAEGRVRVKASTITSCPPRGSRQEVR